MANTTSTTLDYNLLLALKVVHDNATFVKGAAALGITQSAVSQRIKALENQIGVQVLHRGAKLKLTAVGLQLVAHINRVHDLEQDLAGHVPQLKIDRPVLRISVTADCLSTWWFPATQKSTADLGLRFSITVADQDVARAKMETGEVCACLSSSEKALPAALTIHVRTMTYRMYASPSFYVKYFEGHTLPEAIKKAPAVIFGKEDGLHSKYLALHDIKGDFPFHEAPDATGIAQAVFAGIGYGMLTDEQIELIDSGRTLIDISPQHHVPENLYWHYWRNGSALLRQFSESLGVQAYS